MISPETLKAALDIVRKGAAEYEYFFANLTSPGWLEPLVQEGFFQHPPPPLKSGDTITFTFWPESRYLARMAAKPEAAEIVLQVALRIPDTENVYVHEDLADVALGVPPRLAARLAPRLGRAATEHPYRMLLPDKVGALVSHLSQGGEKSAAIELMRMLLTVVPDSRYENDEETRDLLPPEPRPAINSWHYGEIVRKHGGAFIAAARIDGLRVFGQLLDTAVQLSQRPDEVERTEDYSEVWRPRIETERFGRRVVEVLVSAVRDAALLIVRLDSSALSAVIRELERHRWWIFRRLELHLLRVIEDAPVALVSERLSDESLFNRFPREYALLLQAVAQRLPGEVRSLVLDRIERGPDLESFKGGHESFFGRRPTDDEAERWKQQWQLEHLEPLKDALPEEWSVRYRELVAELGAPEEPGYVRTSTTWVGPVSPQSDQDLRVMEIGELIAYLRTWHPPEGPMEPSYEGLGRVLTATVASSPERYAMAAEQFQELDPTYPRALLDGLQQAARDKRAFAWDSPLRLARWVLLQPVDIAGRVGGLGDKDPSWAWCRTTIARLLETGLQDGPGAIPISHRELVWELLSILTEDPNPTPEHEEQYGGSNMDPVTLAMNTTRGEAMDAAIRYGLWVRGSLEKHADAQECLARGLDEMPELRMTLDEHLAKDPSFAIRSVYGRWFPQLTLLDERWAAANAARIFPLAAEEQRRLRAAWDAYVVYRPAYDKVFELLRPIYLGVVDGLDPTSSDERPIKDPDSNLAEHLMMLYSRGRLTFGESDSLLERFFERAGDSLRGYALSFVGRSLAEASSVPDDVLERFTRLWSKRLEAARLSKDVSTFKEEMSAFGWWFESGVFDSRWALTQLREALRLVGKIDPDYRVAERLVTTVATSPLESVECLAAIVEADVTGSSFVAWNDDAKKVLRAALTSGDAKSKEAAETLIHRLGAMGRWDFRDLLRG